MARERSAAIARHSRTHMSSGVPGLLCLPACAGHPIGQASIPTVNPGESNSKTARTRFRLRPHNGLLSRTRGRIQGPPTVEMVPYKVADDSYRPDAQVASSTIEIQRYPSGAPGQEMLYYKAEGMEHRRPSPTQT